MNLKKNFISLILLAIFVFTFVACSSTKNVCPAYSRIDHERSVSPSGLNVIGNLLWHRFCCIDS